MFFNLEDDKNYVPESVTQVVEVPEPECKVLFLDLVDSHGNGSHAMMDPAKAVTTHLNNLVAAYGEEFVKILVEEMFKKVA